MPTTQLELGLLEGEYGMVATTLKRSFYMLVILLFQELAYATQEIVLWHSLEGPISEKFIEIVNKYNQKPENIQANIKVVPHFKGDYQETLTAGLKALRTPEAPQILQVYDVGSLVMQAHPDSYVPLDKLSDKESPTLKSDHFIQAISAFYKDKHGRKELPGLPFSTYSVVLFYNKDAFRKAGLDPEKPPVTWEEFERIGPILQVVLNKKNPNDNKVQTAKYIMASTWLSGHHIEQLGAWHNQAVATKGNGVDGDGAMLMVNQPFFIEHLNKLATWHQKGLFSLASGIKAEEVFAKEDVIMLTDGSNHLNILEKLVNGKFEIGVTHLPFWGAKVKEPYNTAIAGASFWALAGHDPKDYPIIQDFFEYLASPEVQAEWHQETCYLPVVNDARAVAEKQGFYKAGLKGKVAEVALDSFMKNSPQEYSRGILLPEYSVIREVIVHEMKESIKGKKTAAQALDQIVMIGNKIMAGEIVP